MEPLNIAIFAEPPLIEPCVLNLPTLATTKSCQYLGIGAEILGTALEIAQLPYQLVKFHNYSTDDIGVYDEMEDRWSGTSFVL